jgi:DNA modification methylase
MASRIEHWPLDRFIPYARNARTHSDEQVAQIAASIKEFGFVNPILVGPDRVIIAGHARLMAARKLGLTEAPVIVVEGLTENQRRALALADNRLPMEAGWDEAMLRLEIEALRDTDYDVDVIGFDDEALARLLAQQEAAGGFTDEDAVPEPPAQPASAPGDLWLLGDHRLMCGDCTKPEVVAKVLNGAEPILLVTDPPYGIELDSEWRDRAGLNGCGPAEPSYMKKHRTAGHTQTTISGDTRADWSEAYELVPSIQVAYVWHASRFTREVLNGLERIGYLYPQQLIWNKGRVVLTRTLYWFQHEPCWFVRKKRAPWYGKSGSENSTIWDSPSPKFIMGGSDEEKFDHPTQKPVELMRKPIRNHTVPGEIVYEPFCGSGTTLIAAEQTGRICYAVELDPKYVDVIVRRWQSFTGKHATLDGDGRTFEVVAEERIRVAQ